VSKFGFECTVITVTIVLLKAFTVKKSFTKFSEIFHKLILFIADYFYNIYLTLILLNNETNKCEYNNQK
jgi:hypothetical protein